MPMLPNPFDPAASDAAAGQAVASNLLPPAQDAAADLFHSGDTDCPPDEAAAAPRQSADAAVDLIAEIFVGARKLETVEMWFENAAYPREDELLFEVLEAIADPSLPGLAEMPYGMEWALDPAPLFLRQAG